MMRNAGHVGLIIASLLVVGGCQSSGGGADAAGDGTQATMAEDTGSTAPGDSIRPGTPALIEFTRDIRDQDLSWLRENGFQVDTVMGPRTVRGRLTEPARGEDIARDPRVASIEALMR